MADDKKDDKKPGWEAWGTLVGLPASSMAVGAYFKNPAAGFGVAALSAIGVTLATPIGKHYKSKYDKWIDDKTKGWTGIGTGFR
jgi:hypothetical protein